MKFVFYSLIIISFLFGACNNVSKKEMEEASEFNSKIVGHTKPITFKINALVEQVKVIMNNGIKAKPISNEVEMLKKDLISLNEMIKSSSNSLNNLSEFDEKIKFKEAALKYLSVCEETLNKEFSELIATIQNEMTQENILKSGKLTLIVFEKLVEIEKETIAVQRELSNKYMFEIEDNNRDWDMIDKQIEDYKKKLNVE